MESNVTQTEKNTKLYMFKHTIKRQKSKISLFRLSKNNLHNVKLITVFFNYEITVSTMIMIENSLVQFISDKST